MTLGEVFRFLEKRGYELRPCVGNSWYELLSPGGEAMLVKEEDLVRAFLAGEPGRFWEWLRKAQLCREL
ncbi:hypothetical protein Adeg_0812 [Ammonifex degensii KC4]|uniref:Uncharacterized protein n=1 Tax=Ammonifex degensii (strain DSM 10501 / KC4) TaxID=429009 RepID=C9RCH7_AMMDK|nr:hypothetical protein [Ammonifex degensii]ACX51954.1 hypothetical protein Adeg_0812 [Ammonifex degensii KC4]